MKGLCYNCFLEKAEEGPCPHCGYDDSGQADKYPLALKQGAILNGRYTVGRVLGQGGFGITYLAQDFHTKERIAIKEYLPTEFVGRTQGTYAVQVYSGARQENFEYGKTQFLNEAKTLAQVQGNEHIVRVFRYFEENNTAYFVMEYVDGPSLAQYMKERGGRLSPEDACSLLLPVMEALDWVHQKGIVHRDIAPDNILIARSGCAKILDFGAARYSTGEKSKSLDVILKHGFAPKEQYQRHGRQGPFTDVYAMAATYYYAITGKTPPDAIDRMEDDTLIPPSTLGVRISDEAEEVLYKALEVTASNRYQSMGQFAAALKAAVGTGAESADTAIPGKAEVPNYSSQTEMSEIPITPVSGKEGVLPEPKPLDLLPADPVSSTAGNTKKKSQPNKKFVIAAIAAAFLLMAGLGATAERIAQSRKTSSPQVEQESMQQAAQNVQDTDSAFSVESENAVAQAAEFHSLQEANCNPIAVDSHLVALTNNGTLVGAGENYVPGDDKNRLGRLDVFDWEDIVSVSAGTYHTAGLKSDGTVVATGQIIDWDNDGKKIYPDISGDVADWTDIIAIDSCGDDIAGLKADGTVVSTNEYDAKRSADWTDIVSIALGGELFGLKADGTVVNTDVNNSYYAETLEWTDIVKIAASDSDVLGLKSDGTVVTVSQYNTSGQANVSDWTDIVDIASGSYRSVGLKSDGTVVYAGQDLNDSNQKVNMSEVISSWTDIVAVFAGDSSVVGLKADGSIVFAGYDWSGLVINDTGTGFVDRDDIGEDFRQWQNIYVPERYR